MINNLSCLNVHLQNFSITGVYIMQNTMALVVVGGWWWLDAGEKLEKGKRKGEKIV